MKREYVVGTTAFRSPPLFLIFHGVGDNPASMAEIGRYFANAFSASCLALL